MFINLMLLLQSYAFCSQHRLLSQRLPILISIIKAQLLVHRNGSQRVKVHRLLWPEPLLLLHDVCAARRRVVHPARDIGARRVGAVNVKIVSEARDVAPIRLRVARKHLLLVEHLATIIEEEGTLLNRRKNTP